MSDNYPLFVSSIPAESGYLRVPKSNNNRNMKQIICILALLLMSVTTTKAQTSPTTPSIRGKILTEEKQPIEFANIALLSEDSTFIQGTCSRSDGSFELLPPAPGNYLLQISSIGYKTLCQKRYTPHQRSAVRGYVSIRRWHHSRMQAGFAVRLSPTFRPLVGKRDGRR